MKAQTDGFTLVEMMISLLIFAMLAAAGVALLSFSAKAQEIASVKLKDLSEVRRASAILTADLAQAVPRISRDEAGTVHPAFDGGDGQASGPLMSLVRAGWENLDNADRPSIQKVEYRLIGDTLARRGWRYVDGAPPMPPVPVLTQVKSVRLRYRDKDGNWRDRWDPERIDVMPVAVEMIVDTQSYGSIRQLFLVGPSPR